MKQKTYITNIFRQSVWFAIAFEILLFLFPSLSIALLNQNCTVSVLNRTAQVKDDGSWVIPNVPSNMGKVRVRATCVENGITRSGQSDWVIVPANGSIKVGDISLDVFDPVPSAVTIASPATPDFTLNPVGTTAQLVVTATYPDSSMSDITQGSQGTVYGTTNPNIATVSDDGLVTATGTGKVIISASSEMVLASRLFTITNTTGSNDGDNDGIPDDWELANGLNPYEHYDALEDADHDGLTNKQEYDNGTLLRTADSDGDGIKDGEEVKSGDDGYITNPLLADSDGDGVRDGLEIQTGSDPTNSASINLAQALSSLEVTPSNFVIVFNTIMSEASRQLTVTGVLTDGTRIDLTSSARGTNYNSSDLSIANFGATDGLVYAGANGVASITASNSGFNAVSRVVVRAFSPKALSYISIPGYANNVDVNNNYAYVAAGSAGLQIVDVSNINSPYIIGFMDTPGTAIDVRIAGNLAYIADGESGLQIMNISNPASPVIVGSLDTPGIAQDIVIAGTRAFIADGFSGLSIIDISSPSVPVILGTINLFGTARGIAVRDNTVLVIVDNTLKVIDCSVVSSPQLIGSVNVPGNPKDLTVRGNFAYVASYAGGLQIADFSNPSSPVIAGSLPTQFVPRDVELWGQFAFFAEQLFPNAIAIADISDSTNPAFRAILDLSGLGDYAGTGIAITNNYAFVTEESYAVWIDYGSTGNTRLFIGQYAELVDEGTTPPEVSITSPVSGAEVYEGAIIPISVSASDDVMVGAVSLLIDGEVIGTDNSAPFQFNYQVAMSINSFAIGATALDLANNMGTAGNVFITVIPDPPPTVNITSPAEGGNVIEDDTITITASASDNAGITLLEFMMDGQVVSSDTTAPFQAQYHVPAGSVTLTIGARATDTVGHKVNAEEVVVNVIPNTPPVVSITNPVSGAEVIEGSTIILSASATDDLSVASVEFMVDGSVAATDSYAPYQVVYHVPVGVTGLVIKAVVLDNSGHTGVSDEINITVIPDPGTTVTGRVVGMTGQPIAGADVSAFNLHSVSDQDGLFSISGVPTVQGNIAVTATAVVNGETLQGASAVTVPVPYGITDVGDIFMSNHEPWAWGYNWYGQLGNGFYWKINTPVQTGSLNGMTAVSAGQYHNLALKGDGTVWSWGSNWSGQLGDGTQNDSNTPAQVEGLAGVTAISAGSNHSLALKGDGTVWAWGYNGNGQLGDGTNNHSIVPVQIPGLAGVTAISAKFNHNLALKGDGTVWAWGSNWNGVLGDGTNIDRNVPVQVIGLDGVTAVSSGYFHSLALKGDGTVRAWGYNASGQLGNGSTISSNIPVQVTGLAGVTAISGGSHHSLALKEDGTAWGWGYNGSGQLGNGSTISKSILPVQVTGLEGVTTISGGGDHSLAIKVDGTAWAWGHNYYGQLGNGSTISKSILPVQVTGLEGVTAISAGNYHSLAVMGDGTVRAWGSSEYGLLGTGQWLKENKPVIIAGLSYIAGISGGADHSLAVKEDGTAWAWGYNGYGQLGDNTNNDRSTPVQVTGLAGVTAISAGGSHSLVLKVDGTAWGWGGNWNGQLGDGTSNNRLVPVQVTGLEGVTAISAGDRHSLAVKGDGTVWAWGYNGNGQLGNGTNNYSLVPVQVTGLEGVIAVSAGYSHSLALRVDGTVWAWGDNDYGQLGDGTYNNESNVPVQVTGLQGVIAISAGTRHSLALKGDGTAWGWGYNEDGELGDGTDNDKLTAVQVTGLTGVTAISAGKYHSLGLKGDGTAWSWGSNRDGQLGDGTYTDNDSFVPVQVIGISSVIAIDAGEYHSLAIK